MEQEAAKYINEELKVNSVDEALSGARDIIAEWINEDGDARAKMRELYFEKGEFRSKVIKKREAEGTNYKDYFDWQESVKTCPSHRVLAVRRAEKEQFVTLRVIVPEDEALQILETQFVKGSGPASQQVRLALQDGFKRLLSLSMETEVRVASKEAADKGRHYGLCRQPAAAPDVSAAGAPERDGGRPGLPHGVQDRLPEP